MRLKTLVPEGIIWDGVSITLDGPISFDLKVNGSKDLALKIQGIIDDTNESTMRLKNLV